MAAFSEAPPVRSLSTHAAIDNYVQVLTTALQEAIEFSVPWAKSSAMAKSFWNEECEKAVKEARLKRKTWNATHSQQSWDDFVAACKRKKRIIAKMKRNEFRTGMREATESSDKIWRLVRWAKDKSHAPREIPKMPTLCANGVEAKTFEEKIDMLKSYLFPPPSTPDLTDMEQAVYPKEVDCPKNITREEVHATIKRQHSDKAPGPDGIPNRVLKALAESLIIWLLPMFQACVDTSYHALAFKTANTITIKKARKSRLHRSKSVSINCAIEHYRKDPGSYSRQKTKSTRRIAKFAPRFSLQCASPLFYLQNQH